MRVSGIVVWIVHQEDVFSIVIVQRVHPACDVKPESRPQRASQESGEMLKLAFLRSCALDRSLGGLR